MAGLPEVLSEPFWPRSMSILSRFPIQYSDIFLQIKIHSSGLMLAVEYACIQR